MSSETGSAMAKQPRKAARRGDDPEKDVMSVQMTPQAREKLEQLVSAYGIQKLKLTERVLTWLAFAPKEVQHMVMVPIPDTLRGAYAEALIAVANGMRAVKVEGTTNGKELHAEATPPPSGARPVDVTLQDGTESTEWMEGQAKDPTPPAHETGTPAPPRSRERPPKKPRKRRGVASLP